jgi:uncharacterized protein YutE (UPF0331/DUF86 family)
LSDDQISEYLIGLEKEVKQFKQTLFRTSWYMRGGVTMEDLLHVYSHEDREMLYEIIKENINTTQETRIAFI